MLRVAIDARQPAAVPLAEAAAVIRAGGVVAMPTDTLYGLAANPFSNAAVTRVFAAKGRSAERALPLVAADVDQVINQIGPLSELALRLAAQYWPGPLTLLVARPSSLPADVTGGRDQVGVRVPAHAVPRELCRVCASLLTATSANVTGEPATDDPDEVARSFDRVPWGGVGGVGGLRTVDLLLDAGRTPGGPPSTIVDVTGRVVRLVRPGAIAWDDVQTCVQRG
jgi:L-threonylcarbamoyladenylate synthase